MVPFTIVFSWRIIWSYQIEPKVIVLLADKFQNWRMIVQSVLILDQMWYSNVSDAIAKKHILLYKPLYYKGYIFSGGAI